MKTTTLGGLQKIRWSPSQYRALYKLDKNYKNVTQHTENVAATGNHERKEECEGVLSIVTSLKFLKMMMFLIDLHRVLKFLSLQFQRNDILIIEVEPLLNKTFMALQNLRGGKGMKMLEFSDDFESTGMYKGVKLNRTRHQKHKQEWSNFQMKTGQKMPVSLQNCSVLTTSLSIMSYKPSKNDFPCYLRSLFLSFEYLITRCGLKKTLLIFCCMAIQNCHPY